MKPYRPGRLARRAIATLTALLFCMSMQVQAKSPVHPSKAVFEYSRDPSSLIVSYVLHVGEIAEVDGGPSIRVYGDGFAYVHYPVYMTRSGDYGIELSESEMTDLLNSLLVDGIIEFDPDSARLITRETDRLRREQEGILHFVSDPSTTVMEINLVSYTPPGKPQLQQSNLGKTIRWSGLQSDARQYPDHVAIQKLASAERSLAALMERSDLVKLDAQALRISPLSGKD